MTTSPQYHDDLIVIYTAFRDQVHNARAVLHPSCANDASPSKVFDAVTYVDIDTVAMEMFRQHGLDAHGQDIQDYKPAKEHDLLILLNPCIATEWASQHIREGGYILSNNYHGNTSHMYNNPDAFELVGVIDFVESDRREGDNRVIFSQNLEGLFQPVKDFEELREARPETYEFIQRAYGHLLQFYRGDRKRDTAEERYKIAKEMMGESEELPAKRVADRYIFVKK